MARVVVEVMPKAEILDPQGQAIHRALGRLGHAGVTDVRQGKRFEVTVDGELTDERLDQVRAALDSGARTADAVVEIVYADVPRELWPAARLSVLAQLEYLDA